MSPAPRRRVKTSMPPVDGPNLILSYRWVWYLLSFFIPLCGIFIALFIYDHEDREARRVGRNCLLIGFVFWVLLPSLLLAALFLLVVFTLIGCVASLMPD